VNEGLMKLEERVRELEALVFTHLTLGRQHRVPVRPREGMLAYADGTDWDPGSGAGLYQYRGAAWVFIG
jgi:hypothetical protein